MSRNCIMPAEHGKVKKQGMQVRMEQIHRVRRAFLTMVSAHYQLTVRSLMVLKIQRIKMQVQE